MKSKEGTRFGDPLEMVDAEKARRVRRAAEIFLARHPELSALRVQFDVIAVWSGKLRRIAAAF